MARQHGDRTAVPDGPALPARGWRVSLAHVAPRPLRDDKESVVKWYGVGFDIEEKKRPKVSCAEVRLSQSAAVSSHAGSFGSEHQAARSLVEETFPHFRLRPDYQAFDPNDAATRASGRHRHRPAGDDKLSKEHKAFDIEHRLLMPDSTVDIVHVVDPYGGGRRPRQTTIRRVHNGHHRPREYRGSAAAERGTLRRSEGRLAEAERGLPHTLDSIPTITWPGLPPTATSSS